MHKICVVSRAVVKTTALDVDTPRMEMLVTESLAGRLINILSSANL